MTRGRTEISESSHVLLMSCTGRYIPRPCRTSSALLYLTCVIMLKLCGRPGKHGLLSQIYSCMKMWTKARRRWKTLESKTKQKKNPTEGCGISGCGEKKLSLFVFFCADSPSSQWQNSQLVSGTCCLPSQCSLIFHHEWEIEGGNLCFWLEPAWMFLQKQEFRRRFKTVTVQTLWETWLLCPALECINL